MVFGWKHFLKQKTQSKMQHDFLSLVCRCIVCCTFVQSGALISWMVPIVLLYIQVSQGCCSHLLSLIFLLNLYKTTCQNIYKTQSFAPTNFCGLKDCGVFLYLWWTQAMRFGRLPDWALDLSSQIRNSVLKFKSMDSKCSTKAEPISSPSMAAQSQCPLPEDILLREPLFDQMIANSYEPGEVRFCNDSLFTLIGFDTF